MFYTRFPNRANECFGSSLADYFDLNGHPTLADKVYKEFRNHPFVAADGSVRALFCTRLVHDLTDGQYNGIFKYLNFPKDTRKSLARDIGKYASKALKAIDEEMVAGRLVGGSTSFGYSGQALVLQSLPTRKLLHWIVDCDDGTVINNGAIRTITDPQLFFSTIQAVLQIEEA